MSPSPGNCFPRKEHKNRVMASPVQTTLPTKRSVAVMNARNTVKVFLKQRRGFLYRVTRIIALGIEIINISAANGIPVPRQRDFSNVRSIVSENSCCMNDSFQKRYKKISQSLFVSPSNDFLQQTVRLKLTTINRICIVNRRIFAFLT